MADVSKLARDVAKALRDDPTLEVDQLAGQFGVDPPEIIQVLDEHRVDEDGKVQYVGPGGGGGWIQEPVPEE